MTAGRDWDLEELLDEALPALPCLSWLWLEAGRLPARFEFEEAAVFALGIVL
jgi:hypothetical protein